MYIAVLSRTARLFFMFALNIGMSFDRLSVSDFSRACDHVYVESFLQLGDDDAQLHFSLGSQKSLLCLGILAYDERRILLSQARQTGAHLLLLPFFRRSDCGVQRRRR